MGRHLHDGEYGSLRILDTDQPSPPLESPPWDAAVPRQVQCLLLREHPHLPLEIHVPVWWDRSHLRPDLQDASYTPFPLVAAFPRLLGEHVIARIVLDSDPAVHVQPEGCLVECGIFSWFVRVQFSPEVGAGVPSSPANPLWTFGCHSENTAPLGSAKAASTPERKYHGPCQDLGSQRLALPRLWPAHLPRRT